MTNFDTNAPSLPVRVRIGQASTWIIFQALWKKRPSERRRRLLPVFIPTSSTKDAFLSPRRVEISTYSIVFWEATAE